VNVRESDGEGCEVEGEDGGDCGLDTGPGRERVDDRLVPKCIPSLKRKSHEIFDLHFFHKSMAPRALINTLKYFRNLFRFRGENRDYVLTQRYVAQRGVEIFDTLKSTSSANSKNN
jgi:hypothetical protein